MKKLIILLFLLPVFCLSSSAQSGDLTLTILSPDKIDKVSDGQAAVLKSKMTEIVTANGIGSASYDQPFVIYPVFNVNSIQSTAGGMRTIKVADCYISLFIKEVNSNTIFSSFSRTIKGSGTSDDLAVGNAISQLSADDQQIKQFIKDGKQKVLDYYNKNCSMVITKADQAATVKNYDYAVALLMSVPPEATSCYSQAQAKLPAVYNLFQKQQCENLIIKAKAMATNNDFNGAVRTISQIDATSSCKDEAKNLLDEWTTAVDDETKKAREFFLNVYNGQVEVQKARYQYYAQAAANYWYAQPVRITYYTVYR